MTTPRTRTRPAASTQTGTITTTVVDKHKAAPRSREFVEETIKDETRHHERRGLPDEETAFLEVGGGATVNTGNFSSVRVDVRLRWPFPANEEALEKTYDWASRKVEAMLQKEIDMAIPSDQPV